MEPRYLWLAEELEREIRRREGAPYRLPPERELAESRGVSRQTVRRSLEVLEKKGLVRRRQGSGSYANQEHASKGRSLGLLLPGEAQSPWAALCREFSGVCSQEGCSLQIFYTENRLERERSLLESLLSRPVEGLCVGGTQSALPNPNLDLYRRLEKAGTSLVFMEGAYRGLEEQVSVSMDNRAGSYQAVRRLMERGRSRIGWLLERDSLAGLERYEGCLLALRDYGLPMEEAGFLWYDARQYIQPGERAALMEYSAGKLARECGGVICQNEETARELLRAMKRLPERSQELPALIAFAQGAFAPERSGEAQLLRCAGPSVGETAARKLLRLTAGRKERSLRLEWKVE